MNNIIVTELSKNIRTMAREALAGKWKIAAIATIVYLIALMLPASILNIIFGGDIGYSGLSGLYTFLVAAPFTVGYSIFCINIFRNKEIEVSQVFYGFEKFGKAIGLFFVMGVFIFLWLLLFIIPGIIAAYRYSQAFLVMIDHPEYGIMQCIAESKQMMRSNKFKFFCLELSFIGWGLLASLPAMVLGGVLGFAMASSGSTSVLLTEVINYIAMIGYIWLTPYMSVAAVVFYEIANGNLRPGLIEGNATIIDDNRNNAETFFEDTTVNLDKGNKDQL